MVAPRSTAEVLRARLVMQGKECTVYSVLEQMIN